MGEITSNNSITITNKNITAIFAQNFNSYGYCTHWKEYETHFLLSLVMQYCQGKQLHHEGKLVVLLRENYRWLYTLITESVLYRLLKYYRIT